MLKKAFKRKSKDDDLLIHSGQGWHYQMKKYRLALRKKYIIQSMSRKGNCYDNAVIENFYGILKSEFLYYQDLKVSSILSKSSESISITIITNE